MTLSPTNEKKKANLIIKISHLFTFWIFGAPFIKEKNTKKHDGLQNTHSKHLQKRKSLPDCWGRFIHISY